MTETREYESQAARDAAVQGYGDETYWRYLDDAAMRQRDYYRERGDGWEADRMMTRSLTEALVGNDGA
jgi:hypothetical protein